MRIGWRRALLPRVVAEIVFCTGVIVLGMARGNAVAAARGGAENPAAVLTVRGRGVSGRKPYRGGGKVAFLSVALPAQLIHYSPGSKRFAFPLTLRYDVLEPGPIWLTSRFGTEYWRLFQYGPKKETPVYTDEKVDLRRKGEGVARAEFAAPASNRGAPLGKGLCGLVGHYYFLIDKPGGDWLDVASPPPIFASASWTRRLLFTLADLSHYSLDIAALQSTWTPGGPIRVRIEVRDAAGARFPVVNVRAKILAGAASIPLRTQFDWLQIPTGWMAGRLPGKGVPGKVAVRAEVRVLGPDGKTTVRRLEKTFRAGTGRTPAKSLLAGRGPIQFPRTGSGRILETRAMWVAGSDILTRSAIRKLVDRAAEARLNVLLPSVFVRSTLLLHSPLFPMSPRVEKGLDPLAYLIRLAHARRIEVHPWFCVTYRDAAFRKRFPGVDMIDKHGKVIPMGADVQRPKYRKFIVDLMVGVARDYPVDGIHLDYIRSMGQCWCRKCREEFRRKFGKPLEQATDADWTAWERAAIGDIVRRTAEGVRKVRPRAILSAAVFSDLRGGALQGQDPAGWCRRGWLDVAIPMDYKMQTLRVYSTEKAFLDALDDDGDLVTGLSMYQRNGRAVSSRPASLVRDQILLVRRMGIHGYCLFVDRYLDDAILKMLRNELNREPALPYFRREPERAGVGPGR